MLNTHLTRFKSERHVFTEEINKIALSWNDYKKNKVNWYNRNICTWNEQSSYMEERKN